MAEIEFIYNGQKSIVQCNIDDKMKDIFKKYAAKIDKDISIFIFLYGGAGVNEELTFNEQANDEDKKRKKMIILVNENNETIIEKNKIKKSKYAICPFCKEQTRMCIKDYKVNIFDCKNGHKNDNFLPEEFEKTQYIDESQIICDSCKKVNKSNTFNNEFFICNDCKINLCPLCKSTHNKGHYIINYDQKNFVCNLHSQSYNSYCKKCRKNLCLFCEQDHIGHDITSYGMIMPKLKDLKNILSEFKSELDKFNSNIKEIIRKLNMIMDYLEIYYKLYDDMIKNFDTKYIITKP